MTIEKFNALMQEQQTPLFRVLANIQQLEGSELIMGEWIPWMKEREF